MDLPDSLKYVIVHCGTNNVGKDGPVDIVNALLLTLRWARGWKKVFPIFSELGRGFL